MGVSHLLSVRELLEAMSEQEYLEPRGVSAALVASELFAPELVVASALRVAYARGLVRRSGWDPRHREWRWQLTDIGRARLFSRLRAA